MSSSLGERLKNRRRELNLTLAQLTELCEISPQLISDYENGRKEPGVKNIKLLCKALNVYPNYFLLDDDSDIVSAKKNTYGHILKNYIEAIELSKNDQLIVDREKREVIIKITDQNLVTLFSVIEPSVNINNDFAKGIKQSMIAMASSAEIKKDEE